MMAEDVGPVDICIARLGLAVVVSRETLLRVGDVKSPINSSLEQQQPKKMINKISKIKYYKKIKSGSLNHTPWGCQEIIPLLQWRFL